MIPFILRKEVRLKSLLHVATSNQPTSWRPQYGKPILHLKPGEELLGFASSELVNSHSGFAKTNVIIGTIYKLHNRKRIAYHEMYYAFGLFGHFPNDMYFV
ncbi:hypothetical protein GLW08_05395 [Pontibacillus yanchengensis]|uniref:Uncharacterized protein n=1 Tax=Pontibacillus yanchengensis TaxID=462910 RepID=A0ACC7VF31_9BACI|nr:hypothetical protein [Pontibacillus yanchengensis]MYL52769.1 hypothetical protein [Pontibacillus yanchengensis]